MFIWISILVVTLSCGQTSAVVDKRFPTNRNGDKMTNVVKKDGFLFVAENGILHQLDSELASIKSFNTCASDNCNNINKVLAVSGELLVLCGTGNSGVCQAFENDEGKYSSSSDSSDSNYLTVSTSINTPAVGIAFEGQFYLGLGMKNEDGRTYRNYITRTRIADNFENTGSAYIYGTDHPVYFKDVFQHNRSISFLTNQRNNLAPNKMVSKLIRINVDKPFDTKKNLSYTETVLICQAGGDDYSLLQDGAYLPTKGVLVAVFSKGNDPENLLSNSAVCVYNIGALGAVVHQTAFLKLNNTRITKVKGIDRYDLYPDVFIGTYNGSVIKLSVDDSLQIHMYEPSRTIDRGHPITDIHIGQDKGYVVTNRKISSFDNTECSIFKTCMETMAVRNPACGWCLTYSTSTKMSECPQGWISSLSECVSIDVSPKYIAVSEIRRSDVTIKVENIPVDLTTEMGCIYYKGSNQIGSLIPATRVRDNVFTCTFLSTQEHTEQTLQLFAFNNSKLLFAYAKTTIQIYNCSFYTTCGNCLQSLEVNCHWCAKSLTCQPPSSSCDMQVTDRARCPKLETSEIYLPNGITKEITLNVTNMDTALGYVCSIDQNETHVVGPALIDNNNSIKCVLNVSFVEDLPKMALPLSVYQVEGQTKAKIENTLNVTVYKCEYLAADCTRCGALKPSRYDCKWCQSGKCGHITRCSQNVSCPLPQITKVYPPSGGYKGGTKLQITGTNFGTSSNFISDVMVGDQRCYGMNVLQDRSPDFDQFNKEIQCVSRYLYGEERVGTKNVTFAFDGIRCGYGIYSFLNPVVTKIEPSFGPAIGGTLITLSGTDLDIEGSLPRVRLGIYGFCLNVIRHNNR